MLLIVNNEYVTLSTYSQGIHNHLLRQCIPELQKLNDEHYQRKEQIRQQQLADEKAKEELRQKQIEEALLASL